MTEERKGIAIRLEDPEEVKKLDCQDCGCCCRPLQDGMGYYARLTDEEDETNHRLMLAGSKYWHPETGKVHLTTKHTQHGTQCMFLAGDIGDRCSCRVYEHRPQVCRDFTQGSRDCLGMRCYFLNPAVVELRKQYAMRGEFLKPFWLDVPAPEGGEK